MISITKDGILRPVHFLILQNRMNSFSDFSLMHSPVFYNLTILNSSMLFKQAILSLASWHFLIPFPLSEIISSAPILTSPSGSLLNPWLFKNQLKPLYLVRSSMTYPPLQPPFQFFEQFLKQSMSLKRVDKYITRQIGSLFSYPVQYPGNIVLRPRNEVCVNV